MEENKPSCRPWSYSKLSTYTECPKKFWYQYIESLPSARQPSPAMERGLSIHEQAEKYLTGELKWYPPELHKVSGYAMLLKAKQAIPEKRFAVKQDWTPCDFKDGEAYFRSIIDALYVDGPTVHIVDWKTGQVYDHHSVQMEQYVAIVSAHYPEAERFETRLVYTDQGLVPKPKVTEVGRLKGIRILLDGQIQNAESDDIYPTRPGSHCRFCDYSGRHGGPCKDG